MPTPVLRGVRTELRSLRLSDMEALDRVLRDRRATRFLPARVRRETGRQFVTRVLREYRRGGGPAFAIRSRETAETIGQIRFINWSSANREAEVGYWIRRKHWGRGHGTEALRLACQFGFRTMGLHRIEAIVVVGNRRSRRALEKVGFRMEGLSRQVSRIGSRWQDEWRFGLLRGELRNAPGRQAPPDRSRTRRAR